MKPQPFDFDASLIERHPKSRFREVGEDIFLVHPDGESLYTLNPMAAALWRLMERPMSGRDMADVVMTAFPIMAPARIEGDVRALLSDLLVQGFARLAGGGGGRKRS